MSLLTQVGGFCRWLPRWIAWRRWRDRQPFKVFWRRENVEYFGRGERVSIDFVNLEAAARSELRIGLQLSTMRHIRPNGSLETTNYSRELTDSIFEDIRADFAMQGGEVVRMP